MSEESTRVSQADEIESETAFGSDTKDSATTSERTTHTSTRERVLSQVRSDSIALIGGTIVVVMVALTVFSIIDEFLLGRRLISLALHDPYALNPDARLESPSLTHPLGTDEQGRDMLARLIYGARTSMIVGVVAVSFAATVGVAIGTITAYYGSLIDMVGMRAMDVILAFPAILLAISLMAILGRGVENVILAIGIVYIPTFARITRSEVLAKKSEEYIDAAHVIGYPDRTIMGREILPNCLTPIIVQFTFSLALAIIAEAALSFLGLGVAPPTPTWGLMLSDAQDYMTTAWWYSLFPGVFIMITVLGFNLLGDSLRDALDPQQEREARGRI